MKTDMVQQRARQTVTFCAKGRRENVSLTRPRTQFYAKGKK